MEAGGPAILARVNVVERPAALALTTKDPAIPFAVNTVEVAIPDASVTTVLIPPAKVPLAPVAGAAKVTGTRLTPLLFASLTITCNRFGNAVLTEACCSEPPTTASDVGSPVVFVRVKLAVAADSQEATMVYVPTLELAVMTPEMATPWMFAVAVLTSPAKLPLGPLFVGVVKVTVALVAGLPAASVTVTTSGFVNRLLT